MFYRIENKTKQQPACFIDACFSKQRMLGFSFGAISNGHVYATMQAPSSTQLNAHVFPTNARMPHLILPNSFCKRNAQCTFQCECAFSHELIRKQHSKYHSAKPPSPYMFPSIHLHPKTATMYDQGHKHDQTYTGHLVIYDIYPH